MSEKDKSVSKTSADTDRIVFRVNCVWISYAHTFCAGGAFVFALIVGCLLHYEKIVENEHYGYPQEWFPSVSATIGDRYPERSIYQLMIALTSGPRFLLVILTYVLTAKANSWIPKALLISGILRTFTCGGWTYVTSTDDHDWHDIFMISYLVLTIPWTLLRTIITPSGPAKKYRTLFASLFFGTLIPLIYFFIQHKVKKIPGAYTIYAFFEWSLVILDVAFDSVTSWDFSDLEFTVNDSGKVTAQVTDVPALRDLAYLRSGPPVLGFVVSILNWSIWWSVVTSVGAMVWYFPLWYMGISGYEAFALTIAAPVFLVLPHLRKLLQRFPELGFLGQIVGVGAYWVKSPQSRMMYVGIGAGFASMTFAAVFTSAHASSRPGVLASQSIAFVLGLLLTVAARIKGYTNNPIWPIVKPGIGGINPWGVGFGIVGALFASAMVPDRKYSTHSDSKVTSSKATGSKPASSTVGAKKPCAILVGLGLGAQLFLLTTFCTDVSNIPLWVWEGYPLRGPSPLPHGALLFLAMTLGLLTGVKSKWQLSKIALVLFNASMIGLSQLKHWFGFISGLYVAFYLSAVAPALLESASYFHPAKSFALAMFIYVLLIFAETWTVAYAFVPGGFALRERTWIVLAAEQLLVSLGTLTVTKTWKISSAASKLTKLATWGLIIILSLASLFTFERLQHPAPAPVHPESKALTAGIWTIHFGLDNDLWASETRMRDLIRDAELDVVGFLESDTQRIIGGHRDITQQIAEELGFYADYGPSADKHTWGAALLSRFPIVQSTHHLTPSPVGELAPAIHATLDVYGELVDVIVFHSGQEEDPEDRRLQTKYVTELHAAIGDRPTIQLSYLVTPPLQGNYNTWVSDFSGMHDIDPTDDDRWCEYILYKNLKRTGYARISRDTITDTELQVGRFQIGSKPDYSNTRVKENDVEPGLRFPQQFRGEGIRGHRYHVFDEPRYFL